MTASEIVGVRLNLPEDWYDVDLEAESPAEWIASLPVKFDGSVDQELFAGLMASLREAMLVDEVDVAAIQLKSPNRGNVGAALLFELLNRGPHDTPESFLEFAESHKDLRTPELDISSFVSWTGEHPSGPYVAFTYLALVTTPGREESALEERAVYTLFPKSATQLVQITFRTARLGVFDDIAEETSTMVGNIELDLEPA
ncbi:hypothetical protein [Mycetocola zhadangensis]|uniref:Uncharacterized protein n=1 Tax=Mycetocola zhadangensis TaxID=1164595 RepID=A0A3L7J4J2_9MICO|nr:hypothetical protein [Mycetocola zhadangensis]RLQ85369.1 hypothetical protein D9V28_00275 [Mycetocola zhadangensis]GGE81996.1 hypothetical protein GCM10011313_00540 [Mycetocola zhadangensis]